MPAPKYQTQILNNALNHLDPASPHFPGDEAIKQRLSDPCLRSYLQGWVLPNLVALRDDDVPKWMKDSVAGEHASQHYVVQP
jgi:hypothetical protein